MHWITLHEERSSVFVRARGENQCAMIKLKLKPGQSDSCVDLRRVIQAFDKGETWPSILPGVASIVNERSSYSVALTEGVRCGKPDTAGD